MNSCKFNIAWRGRRGSAWKEARKYIEKARPDLYRELQKRGAL